MKRGPMFDIGLILCPRSSEVEHFLGKEVVTGSIPVVGSKRLSWPHITVDLLDM